MKTQVSISTDDDSLLEFAEQMVSNRFGSRASITGIRRARIQYIGSYDCETVTVQFSNREDFAFFLKDYASSQKSKDEPAQRRERELAIYRDLLPRAELGTAGYYGSLWDESERRYWLFLELVEGVLIEDHNVEHGELAAGWLGRAQGFFSRHPDLLSGHDYLICHDAGFFRSKARLALHDVGRIDPASLAKLARIVDGYEQAIDVMTAQPLTLVHGGYIPWHILLNYHHEPVRVCPIDWELAAIGSAFYDLAYFTDGAEPQVRDRIWDAYWRAAVQFNAPVPDRAQIGYIVDCFRLHRVLDWLSRAVEKKFSVEKVSVLVAQAEQQSALIYSH